jgi:hypothetical protein
MTSSVNSSRGFEYEIVKEKSDYDDFNSGSDSVGNSWAEPPYYWQDVKLQAGKSNSLNGFKIKVRYYLDYSSSDDSSSNRNRGYPGFELISMSFTEDKDIFIDNDNNTFDDDSGDKFGVNEYAVAGIRDGAAYAYGKVFDDSNMGFIPRLSTPNQKPLDGKKASIPEEPYNPNADVPVYPIDAMTAYAPDERDSVTVSFTLRTTIRPVGSKQNITSQITISQVCNQDTGDHKGKIQYYQSRSYFANNLMHVGLYPPGTEPIYDDRGNLVGEINEPYSLIQLTRNSYPIDPDTLEPVPYPEQGCA